MTSNPATQRFESVALLGGDGDLARATASAARGGDVEAAADLAALWLHVAAVGPERLADCYDAAAEGWFGRPSAALPIAPPTVPSTATHALPDAFWTSFWDLVLDENTGRDAGDITTRTAALAGMVDESFRRRNAATSLAFPGVAEASAAGDPVPFTLAQLEGHPAGSLAGHLHWLVVEKGFDLEVLDRSALDLSSLPVPLGYLNSRILQCHDIWHEVGGFDTTVLHEIAISGFQLGQFGHHYSSMFLAVTASKVALTQPMAVGLIYDMVLAGWVHGRETPALLGVPWEQLWHEQVDEIRIRLGVSAFRSPHPADLIEQLLAG